MLGVLRVAVRALSAVSAAGTAVAIGFAIDSLNRVDVLKGCGSPSYSTETCPAAFVVYHHIDPRVPHDNLRLYIATLVLMIGVVGLVVLARGQIGAAIATALALFAGVVFLWAQFWYFDIEPGFSAQGSWLAVLLGFITFALLMTSLTIEVVTRGGGNRPRGDTRAHLTPPLAPAGKRG